MNRDKAEFRHIFPGSPDFLPGLCGYSSFMPDISPVPDAKRKKSGKLSESSDSV
jgi:hypothetical protein